MSNRTGRPMSQGRRALILCGVGAVLCLATQVWVESHGPHDLGLIVFGECNCQGSAAVGALRTIDSVQAQFRDGDREGDGVTDYAASLEELHGAGLIDDLLAGGTKSGYTFRLSGGKDAWSVRAAPISEPSGQLHYLLCEQGDIHFRRGGAASCRSRVLWSRHASP